MSPRRRKKDGKEYLYWIAFPSYPNNPRMGRGVYGALRVLGENIRGAMDYMPPDVAEYDLGDFANKAEAISAAKERWPWPSY